MAKCTNENRTPFRDQNALKNQFKTTVYVKFQEITIFLPCLPLTNSLRNSKTWLSLKVEGLDTSKHNKYKFLRTCDFHGVIKSSA